MKKIHTRAKRKWGISTHLRHYSFFHPGLKKKNRPKSFKTEEAANNWAFNRGLQPEKYYIKNVKRGKRFQVMIY